MFKVIGIIKVDDKIRSIAVSSSDNKFLQYLIYFVSDNVKHDICTNFFLIVFWNKNAEIIDTLSQSVCKTFKMPQVEDLVIFVHDMGESSCSTRMRSLIKNAYSKKPNTAVMTIDYSPVVRLYTLFLCMIKNLNLFSYIIFRVVGLITGH